MLLQFSCENYMSFKEKTVLSLKPGAINELAHNIYNSSKNRALKSAVIFGANASGKSNIVKAFTAAIMMIRESSTIQIDQPLNRIIPFKLDKQSYSKPSSFEFILVIENTKYIYGFSATSERITEEYLYAYYSIKPTTVFERTEDKYVFKADKKNLCKLAEKNSSNKLFLTTATVWNYERTKAPYLWFSKQVDTYEGSNWFQEFPEFAHDYGKKQKKFTTRLLEIADISISDYHVKESDTPKERIEAMRADPFLRTLLENTQDNASFKEYLLLTAHQVVEDNTSNTYELNMAEESQGTQNLFFMSSHLKTAFETGKTLVVDEFDSGLHPLLLEEIVRMFHDSSINVGNAQLIFTTHAISLLDLSIFRRDQIFFTERNRSTAVSELFSLDEFPVRKSESIRNGYIYGRYGAIPVITKGRSPWV